MINNFKVKIKEKELRESYEKEFMEKEKLIQELSNKQIELEKKNKKINSFELNQKNDNKDLLKV
jgi:predicted nuclease with TOPRIM domain